MSVPFITVPVNVQVFGTPVTAVQLALVKLPVKVTPLVYVKDTLPPEAKVALVKILPDVIEPVVNARVPTLAGGVADVSKDEGLKPESPVRVDPAKDRVPVVVPVDVKVPS